MADISRRALLGVAGLGAIGTLASWPRLTSRDIPGRGEDALTIAILGTAQDAQARGELVEAFRREHPDIPVQLQAIQGTDWSDFFAKILTMVAAGTPPDLVLVATEGSQLFADRLAEPLDPYVQRDKADMADYFGDVHPSLIESFMYEGSLFQVPVDFNCANLYYNNHAFERAGVGRPDDNWTYQDFLGVARELRDNTEGTFRSYFWTNRLFGGAVPWLYVNNTSFLTESKAPGGEWLWDGFYANDPAAAGRGGGFRWLEAAADQESVIETFEFLAQLVSEDLSSAPAQGGGNELVNRFTDGLIGMTPAGGYWVAGLKDGGMAPDDYDVTYFPRWKSQRHQFGAAGYAMMRTSKRKDEAWEWIKFCAGREGMRLQFPSPNTTPVRRSMHTDEFYVDGPKHWKVFYDTLDKFPETGPIPAPPQQAAVQTALIKNTVEAVTGNTRSALSTMQRDLELAMRSKS